MLQHGPIVWKKILKVVLWVPSATVALFFSIQTYLTYSLTKDAPGLIRQEISVLKQNRIAFAAVPRIALEIKTAMATQDARPLLINRYFERYSSPMAGMGDFIVRTADAKGVNPYLIVAIAQQESNLGKLMPPNCHNAWGWGIHSAGTLCFASWEEGIATFTVGIADKYHAYGLYTPEQLMSKYVPHSPGGAWAKGVQQFLTQLENGDF